VPEIIFTNNDNMKLLSLLFAVHVIAASATPTTQLPSPPDDFDTKKHLERICLVFCHLTSFRDMCGAGTGVITTWETWKECYQEHDGKCRLTCHGEDDSFRV